MQDSRDKKQIMSYLAEGGRARKQADSTFLVMNNGHIVRQSETDEPPQIVTFESYAIDLNRFEPKSDGGGFKPRERYSAILPIPSGRSLLPHQPGQFRAEFHERFSNPLYPLAFVMIAVAFAGQARSTRQNRSWRSSRVPAGGRYPARRPCRQQPRGDPRIGRAAALSAADRGHRYWRGHGPAQCPPRGAPAYLTGCDARGRGSRHSSGAAAMACRSAAHTAESGMTPRCAR